MKTIECKKCGRLNNIEPHIDMRIDGKELNAGHGRILGSAMQCACGYHINEEK